jgi:hypothetical protein
MLTILSGHAGNAWFEFLASTFSKVHDPQFVPIEFEFNKKARKARIAIAGAVETSQGPWSFPTPGRSIA